MRPASFSETRVRLSFPLTIVALVLYAFLLLSIGLTADWRLRHEDNGAMHTTLALSHQRLGLDETRAHDVFVDRHTGGRTIYGHHPPGPPLVIAAAFTLAGTDTPAVARLAILTFHLAMLLLFVRTVAEVLPRGQALLAGFIMATLPMSSYFGRMVNYEPLCLFAILLQLLGYLWSRHGRRAGLPTLAAGVVLGALADWPAFFFAAALAFVELLDLVRGRSRSQATFIVLVITAPAMFVFDLWHLWFAAGGSMERLSRVLTLNRPVWEQEFTLWRFMLGQVETFRRYFTDVGFIAAAVVLYALLRRRGRLAEGLFAGPHAETLRRLLATTALAAGAYLLAAPRWAMTHQYWQFYFLPFVALAMTRCWMLLHQTVVSRGSRRLKIVQLLVGLEMLVASAYWLHFRHTRDETYAIEATADFRERFLLPDYLATDAAVAPPE